MKIEIIDPDPGIDVSRISTTAETVFNGENQHVDYLNVIFLDRESLRSLKKEYLELDVYTDVMTFNLNEPGADIEGEIYLAFDQIRENSVQYKTSLNSELYRVLIHGCLHLCGYNDKTSGEKSEMTLLENKYLSETENNESI